MRTNNQKTTEEAPIVKNNSLLKKVVNIKSAKLQPGVIESLTSNIIDNQDLKDTQLKNATKEMVANAIKYVVGVEHPQLNKVFDKMDYDTMMTYVNKSKIHGTKDDMLEFDLPAELITTTLGEGAVNTYGSSVSISPNSFWANVTNVLNEVMVGDNFINTGKSFNAWNFYRDVTLPSGEAVLKTIGQTLSGVVLLDQNSLVPPNTQMLPGYQASLGVFINVESLQNVGGGQGLGLFTMYATPINVIKLAVTNPKQFADMVRIFEATAVNTREYALWIICTYNLLSNITNVVVDNYNTNIRNCLNGTLFPAIEKMKNPTDEFNCGLIQTYQAYSISTSGGAGQYQQINYDAITSGSLNGVPINATTYMGGDMYTVRMYSGQSATVSIPVNNEYANVIINPSFTSPYTVPGSATAPRIQVADKNEIHLIVTPDFFVGLKSGTLSQLFHWEYQRLEEYIPPENIHLLYKTISIPAGNLTDANVPSGNGNTQGYAWNVPATLSTAWFPDNCIYLITKPSDSNQWTGAYGYVWTTDMRNEWGAGMISTSYLHFAVWGGVIPWSNGVCFYFKNLMNLVSDETQCIFTDFTLGNPVNQAQTITTSSGSGQN